VFMLVSKIKRVATSESSPEPAFGAGT